MTRAITIAKIKVERNSNPAYHPFTITGTVGTGKTATAFERSGKSLHRLLDELARDLNTIDGSLRVVPVSREV